MTDKDILFAEIIGKIKTWNEWLNNTQSSEARAAEIEIIKNSLGEIIKKYDKISTNE